MQWDFAESVMVVSLGVANLGLRKYNADDDAQ